MTTPAALHPDARLVREVDAASAAPLGLTYDEADAVAIEASYLEDDHGGPFAWWVAYVLDDVRRGYRDRRGRRVL